MENNTRALMPLNLQFFADEGGGEAVSPAGGEGAGETTPPATEESTKPANLTALLAGDKAMQAQFDKLVGKALETAQAKWEKEKDMTAEQLAETKAQEMTQELTKREQALVAKELRAEALGFFAEKNVPAEIIDCVNLTDAESMQAHIVKVEKAFRTAVEKAVKEKMAGKPPKDPAGDPAAAQLAKLRSAAGLKPKT